MRLPSLSTSSPPPPPTTTTATTTTTSTTTTTTSRRPSTTAPPTALPRRKSFYTFISRPGRTQQRPPPTPYDLLSSIPSGKQFQNRPLQKSYHESSTSYKNILDAENSPVETTTESVTREEEEVQP